MFVRLVRFTCNPGEHEAAQKVADELTPVISEQPGCGGVWAFGDETSSDYGLVVIWDTEQHANSAAQLVRPKMDELLSGRLKEPIEARLYPVLS